MFDGGLLMYVVVVQPIYGFLQMICTKMIGECGRWYGCGLGNNLYGVKK